AAKAAEEANLVLERARETGIDGQIQHLMIPGMIDEEEDRPVPMKPRMDPLDVWKAVRNEVTDMSGFCTQVTSFLDKKELSARFCSLREAGMEGVIFVGVPRTMQDGDGDGVAPTDALAEFQQAVPNRGVILIPTREGEQGRFNFKCDQGATFGMTQLLYSDAIVGFLKEFARTTEHRPELLLSFGFVPKVENKVKLINWLIQDHGNQAVAEEQAFVARLAEMRLKDKKRELLDLYKRCIDGVRDLGFPLSVHLEAPYGFSKPAFESFAELLDYFNPRNG
ncbi:MAG: hypothetical protein HUJ31_13435, partial [Pseudomonadales bacterium]|nr:hypothetical protein [Pseudomonadales bacterium]